MRKYMLDTNICIALMKGRGQHLQDRFNREGVHMCVSTITAFELQTGVEKSRHRDKSQSVLHALLGNLEILDFGTKGAVHAAEIRGNLETRGQGIGPCDTLIAGHARSEGLVIITDNEKEFSRVDGLRIENWLRQDQNQGTKRGAHER